MNTEELREMFKDILNRTDCTESQVTTLLNLGLGRVERTLRLDLQKTHSDFVGLNVIPLPPTFTSLIHVKLNGKTCQRVTDTYDPEPNCKSLVYVVTEGSIVFPNQIVTPLDTVRVSYFSRATGPDPYADRHADLIIYAALVFAADLFVDDRKASFDQTFAQIAGEVLLANDLNQMTGLDMRVTNPFEGMI